MLKGTKKLLEHNALYIAILCTIAIAILSLMNLSKASINIESSDKISHIIAYFFLSLFWFYGLIKSTSHRIKIVWIALGCFFYGILLEVLQTTITDYRTASYLDILANSMGVLLAVLTFYLFEKKKRFI